MKRWLLALLPVVVGLASLVPACGLQGEGQRCSTKNGNDDCDVAAGLVCRSSVDLGGSSDICCPENGQSEDPACIPGGLGSGATGTGTGTGTTTTTTTTTTGTGTGTGGDGGAGGGTGGGTGTGGGGTGGGTGGAGGGTGGAMP